MFCSQLQKQYNNYYYYLIYHKWSYPLIQIAGENNDYIPKNVGLSMILEVFMSVKKLMYISFPFVHSGRCGVPKEYIGGFSPLGLSPKGRWSIGGASIVSLLYLSIVWPPCYQEVLK